MSGPTVFAECIDTAAVRARSSQEAAEREGKQKYHILLILTDGAVTDIERTKQAITRSSDAPLSIVIVGVGNADFSKMQFLDDFMSNHQHSKQRDIVQFVEFSRFAHDKSALTRETLDEIPDQVVGHFYKNRGIMPLPPKYGPGMLENISSEDEIVIEAEDPDDVDIDLSIEYTGSNEFVLGDTSKLPTYDDTKYGTANEYINLTPVPPPQQQAPAAPYVPNYNGGGTRTPPRNVSPPRQSITPPRNLSTASATAPPQGAFSDALGGNPQQQQIFHVQVPPGVNPGQSLQVQNPFTKQYMIVQVPQGVAPGQKFAVSSS